MMATDEFQDKVPLTQRLRQILRPRSFSRYVIVGVLNTGFGLVCFPVLYWLCRPALSVNALVVINWVLNNLVGFFLHRMVTFTSTGASYKQMPKFLALALFGLGVNLAVMNLVLHFFHANPVLVLYGSTFLLALIFMIINYFGMDRLIFRRNET